MYFLLYSMVLFVIIIYTQTSMYVCMYVRMYERLRKQISPIKIVKFVIKNLNDYNKLIINL
jgi:hypothetical protein